MSTEDTGTETAAPPPPRRRRARVLRHALRACLVLLALPLVFALVAAVALVGNEVAAPSWVADEVEHRAGTMIGGEIEVGAIKVTLGRDLHPRVSLVDARLADGEGRPIAQVPRIDLLISPRGLILRRELLVQEVLFSGAGIALARDADGTIALSFGFDDAVGGVESFAALVEAVDDAFARPELEALESVRAVDVGVTYSDARAGRAWEVDDGVLSVELTEALTVMNATLELDTDRGETATLEASYRSPRGTPEAQMNVILSDAPAPDIASQSAALQWLSVLDAPISARITGGVGHEGNLLPVFASLEIGAGTIVPTDAARPVPFHDAAAALRYQPDLAQVDFMNIAFDSDSVRLTGEGQAYLRGEEGGRPDEIWGQFSFFRLDVNPGALYPGLIELAPATADVKLAFDPFRLTVGQATLKLGGAGAPAPDGTEDEVRLTARGDIWTSVDGWNVAVDGGLDRIGVARARALWPESWFPGARGWFERNLQAGELHDLNASLRASPGQAPRSAVDFEFREARLRFLQRMPPLDAAAGFVQVGGDRFALTVDAGYLETPEDGRVDMSGSDMVIPVLSMPEKTAEFDLQARGTLGAALWVLDQPPVRALSRAGLSPNLATGQAEIEGEILLPLRDTLDPSMVSYDVGAVLTDVESDALVPGRPLSATRIVANATPDGLSIEGAARVGGIPMNGRFSKAFEGGSPARVEASVELGQAFLDAFGIALPRGTVQGTGQGQLTLTLPRGAPPEFSLVSDLNRLTLSLPWVGWLKPASGRGRLEVAGQLGADPEIDSLQLDAGGLSATGGIELGEGGRFVAARFSRLTVGDWLDAPLTLRNRGNGLPVAVEVGGGLLDMRRAAFGSGDGTSGAGGPMRVALDRLQVTGALALTDFSGEFASEGGLRGTFSARVNGGPMVAGSLVPVEGRTGVRVTGGDAGDILAASGLLRNVAGGEVELILRPTGREGEYDGRLVLSDIRVRNAPAMAELLNAISVVGLLQQLDGQGLAFTEVEALFRLTPEQIIVTRSSATGPSLGVSLDGTYTLANELMDFQGVVSPLYLLNGIGSVLTRPGEGLIGFNFNLRGRVGAPRVSVNPLSVLTPGMFREIFRRPPPDVQ